MHNWRFLCKQKTRGLP